MPARITVAHRHGFRKKLPFLCLPCAVLIWLTRGWNPVSTFHRHRACDPSGLVCGSTPGGRAVHLRDVAGWRARPYRHAPRLVSGRRSAVIALEGKNPEAEEGLRVSRTSLVLLLMSAGLSLLGFTMPSPILPALRARFGLCARDVGLISSSFAAGMFFAVMALPGISDRWGRCPVMAVALAITAVGFIAQGVVIGMGLSFQTFLLVRFATGLFAGCNPIFKAYLADVVPLDRLPQFMMYREAAATLAFVVGPTLGGYLASSALGPAGPLYATGIAHAVAALLIAVRVEESVQVLGSSASKNVGASGQTQRIRWLQAVMVFAMSFLYVIGQSCVSSFVPLLMNDQFRSSPRAIGTFTTKMSIVALMCQILCYRAIQKRCGIVATGVLGALAVCAGLTGMGFPTVVPFWVSGVVYALGIATFPATIPTLLSRVVPQSCRGFVLGLDSVANNMCRVLAPVLLGVLYARSPALCFGGAASAMLLVVVILSFVRFGDQKL